MASLENWDLELQFYCQQESKDTLQSVGEPQVSF